MKVVLILFFIIQIFSIKIKQNANIDAENAQRERTKEEMSEILQIYGNLNIDEACVICRYITQKMNKLIDIDKMCPILSENDIIIKSTQPNRDIVLEEADSKIDNETINEIENYDDNKTLVNETIYSFKERERNEQDGKKVEKVKVISKCYYSQRRKFPDDKWLCAEEKIGGLIKELCKNEISFSYQKYCNAIYQQFDIVIERTLFHDNSLEMCQKINMCPYKIEIN